MLVLSRGQAAAVRKFSIYSGILLSNMKTKTLFAIKRVHNAIKTLKIKFIIIRFPMTC